VALADSGIPGPTIGRSDLHRSDAVPYRLETRLWLPAPLPEVFGFFADARNLEAITPPFLRFTVLTPDVTMRTGTLIDYRLRLRGVPIQWRSEITLWEPNVRFRDEQRRGPYRYWKHLHLFGERDGGTAVEDAVDYDVWGGALVHRWFVRDDLIRIFTFRQEALERRFGGRTDARASVTIERR
jgi:ligand-binding SRPBCC domain-containing protein